MECDSNFLYVPLGDRVSYLDLENKMFAQGNFKLCKEAEKCLQSYLPKQQKAIIFIVNPETEKRELYTMVLRLQLFLSNSKVAEKLSPKLLPQELRFHFLLKGTGDEDYIALRGMINKSFNLTTGGQNVVRVVRGTTDRDTLRQDVLSNTKALKLTALKDEDVASVCRLIEDYDEDFGPGDILFETFNPHMSVLDSSVVKPFYPEFQKHVMATIAHLTNLTNDNLLNEEHILNVLKKLDALYTTLKPLYLSEDENLQRFQFKYYNTPGLYKDFVSRLHRETEHLLEALGHIHFMKNQPGSHESFYKKKLGTDKKNPDLDFLKTIQSLLTKVKALAYIGAHANELKGMNGDVTAKLAMLSKPRFFNQVRHLENTDKRTSIERQLDHALEAIETVLHANTPIAKDSVIF